MTLRRLADRFTTFGLAVLGTLGFVVLLDLGRRALPTPTWFAFGLGLGLTTIGLGVCLALGRSTDRP